MKLRAEGNKVIQYDDYEQHEYAICEQPDKAIAMLNRAWDLNEQRHYTASARLLAKVETLPGFKYSEF